MLSLVEGMLGDANGAQFSEIYLSVVLYIIQGTVVFLHSILTGSMAFLLVACFSSVSP